MKVNSPPRCGNFLHGNGDIHGRVAPQIKWDSLPGLRPSMWVSGRDLG